MLISVVVPAFNEETCLPHTLGNLARARQVLRDEMRVESEVIVVDDDSQDSTADIARAFMVKIITVMHHNIAKVRNAGAKSSEGDVLVFVDADTSVPAELLSRVATAMSDNACIGGAVDTDYRPTKRAVHVYLRFWRIIGRLAGMAQGATQFCRRDAFVALKGYDETLFMGEDVDFFWRLKRFAKQQHKRVAIIEDVRVVPSTRRFDQWPLWRTLVWTNPLFILMFRRTKQYWDDWYLSAPR